MEARGKKHKNEIYGTPEYLFEMKMGKMKVKMFSLNGLWKLCLTLINLMVLLNEFLKGLGVDVAQTFTN